MEAKLLEIRDKATFMPALAIQISGADGYLAMRAGYGRPLILLIFLVDNRGNYDPYQWRDRTRQVSHAYIQENWSEIKQDDVIDVEFIMGETTEPKESERCDEGF